MNRFFNVDGKLFTFLSKLCDMLIVSVLWTLFSIPLITMGAASAALYHTVHKSIFQNEGYITSTFWRSFRSSLKQGVLLTLLAFGLGAFCVASYLFFTAEGQNQVFVILYFALFILALLFLLILILYGFPVLSRFYMSFSGILKTSVALAVTRAGFTLLLLFIFLLCASMCLLAPVLLAFLPACYQLAAERLIEPAFQKALDAKEKADHPEESEDQEEPETPEEPETSEKPEEPGA